MRNKTLIFLMIVLMIFVTGCSAKVPTPPPTDKPGSVGEPPSSVKDPEPTEITISAVGDIMAHLTQLQAQYNKQTETYDFSNNFTYVLPYLKRADFTLANVETVFAGESRKYSGYPLFNTPDSLLDALKDTGFDVLATANNHVLDMGKSGVIRTVDVIKDRGLGVIGTKAKAEDESFLIVDVKGIKLGLASYTYETPRVGGQRTMNSITMSEDTAALIDTFSSQTLAADLDKMTARVDLLRQRGAEVVIFMMHWGSEYQRQPNSVQKQLAEALIETGVDIIFGSHPHVIQPAEFIQTSSGSEGIVFYSLGNFLSNQRYELVNQPFTEDGMIASVTVRKETDGTITVGDAAYTPTWVHRFSENGSLGYEIVPLPDALNFKDVFHLNTNDSVSRAQKALTNTNSILQTGSLQAIHVHSLFPAETYKQ